jgi:hypothetical protein
MTVRLAEIECKRLIGMFPELLYLSRVLEADRVHASGIPAQSR